MLMEKTLLFGGKRKTPDIRRLYDMRDVVYDKTWLATASNLELYYMYRDLALSRGDEQIIREHGLRYDITVIPPFMLGCEYVKTAGHYHARVPGMEITYPEVYEVLQGNAQFLLQRVEDGVVEDIVLIRAGPEDKVIIPPNYGHVTINAFNKVLKMANWVARDFSSLYDPIREKGGAAYFVLRDGFVKNPRYGDIPDLRLLEPKAFPEVGLIRKKEMYGLVRNIKDLAFLVEPEDYDWLFRRALG
jgi:glucose-6-phosphate isomerase